MRTLHLFAGAGGGIIADMMLGHEVVGAVEINKYCRSVLRARMNDCLIPEFPIFNDVRSFCGDEVECVEMLCGGFPCQDISTGGKKAGIHGERSGLFFEIIRIVKKARPPFVFLENSHAIRTYGLKEILEQFANEGYDAAWTNMRASDCGAPHLRNRWWGLFWNADSEHNINWNGMQSPEEYKKTYKRKEDYRGGGNAICYRNEIESGICRMADGLADWVDLFKTDGGTFWNWKNKPRIIAELDWQKERLFGIGNGQVPICAAVAQIILFENFLEAMEEEVKEVKK